MNKERFTRPFNRTMKVLELDEARQFLDKLDTFNRTMKVLELSPLLGSRSKCLTFNRTMKVLEHE